MPAGGDQLLQNGISDECLLAVGQPSQLTVFENELDLVAPVVIRILLHRSLDQPVVADDLQL